MVLLRTIEDAAERGEETAAPASGEGPGAPEDWRNRSKFHGRQAREKRKRRYAEMRGGRAHGLR